MLKKYTWNGEEIDSLELKILLITKGMNISPAIAERFEPTRRVSPMDPQACNCLVLPDKTIVHMIHVGAQSPFTLDVDENGKACVAYRENFLTHVDFPPHTAFYEQTTSSGRPFRGTAVLQGFDVLSFPYLWPCEYAKAGFPCAFCFPGNYTHQCVKEGKPDFPSPTPQDVAEIVNYAVREEKVASYVQITGGSSMDPKAECHLVVDMLNAVNNTTGLKNIPGEMLIYTSPPEDPIIIDSIMEGGADRIACDMEVWDEEIVKKVCPGKAKFTGRNRQIRTLEYIADKYGPNKSCSAFVIGVEPAECFLEGAVYLAERGIVPIASVWIPHGMPVMGKSEAPGLDFYRRVKNELAEIYAKYQCEPPGDAGFNVCLCRDTWNHREEITHQPTCCSE